MRNTWQPPTAHPPDVLAVDRELVRYASLAASSHNAQCWKFRIEDQWFALLKAPRKQRFTLENAAHSVAFEQFEAFSKITTKTILPETDPKPDR